MQSSVSVTYPLLLMAVDRAFDEASTARALRFATLSILLCLAGGFPHWILFGAVAAGLYFLLRARGLAARTRSASARSGGSRASTAVAVAILRSLDPRDRALPRTPRNTGPCAAGWAGPTRFRSGTSVSTSCRTTPGRRVATTTRGVGWIPGDNYIETAAGVGLAAAALAFVGLASVRRRTEGLFAVLLGAAVAIPLYAGGRAARRRSEACRFSRSACSRARRS